MDERARLPLRIDRVDSIAGRTRLVVAGELDVETADQVERAVLTARGPEVELDLSAVTFIDSTGLNALLGGRRDAGDVRVVIVGASPQVRRVIELSGLGPWFSADDLDAD